MADNPSNPQCNPQGATILLIGFLILLVSCALILSVRVHVRLGLLTDELIKLNTKLGLNTKDAPVVLVPEKAAAKKSDTPEKLGPKAVETPGTPLTQTKTTLALGETRSPIPQPGEVIEKPLIPAKVGEVAEAKPIAPEPAKGEVIPWDKAHLHMGRTITIEGKIISTKRQATICFLNFTNEASGGESFYLVVFKDNFDDWGGAPEQIFLNKTVRVTGKVEDHRGKPQMKINKKEQVEKME